MATHRFIKVPYVMQATRFLDVPDLPRLLIKDRPIPHVKHQLRASSSQNLPHNLAIDKAQFQEKIMNIELGNSIFQLEGSGPNSLIECTFPDNVVPFNLKELLDTKILQFPKLVSDGDPPPPPPKEVALKTYLNTPPVGNEDRMAQWMNRIGVLIEGKVPQVRNYVTIEGEQSTLPQRRWTAAAAGKPLAASSPYSLKRKPDVALVSIINRESMSLTGSDAWSKVDALCETSVTNLSGNMTIEDTLQQKSYIMFMEQDDRLFNPTLFFSGNSFGFHVFDRTGLRCFVAPCGANSSPKHILRILGCLFFGRPATVGYDETIRTEGGRAKEIYHDKQWWTVDRELHKSESFVGRSTKCWIVSREEEDGGRKTLVLKDTWASTSNAETEPNILRRIRDENINQGRNLPRFHSWSRVDVPITNNEVDDVGRPLMVTDSTSRRNPRDASLLGQADPNQFPRDHCRLLFGPVAYPLSCFINLKDLVGIFYDVMQAHCALWESKILHRDISLNNIMIIPCTLDDIDPSDNSETFLSGEGRHHIGLLNDMDYAFDFTPVPAETVMDPGPSHVLENLLHKTGTAHYMSVQLAHKDIPHHAIHDIESFFYVLLFVTMMFMGPRKEISYKDRRTSGIFGKANDYHDFHLFASVKSAMLHDFDTLDKTLEAMSPYFYDIKPLLVDLCSVVFDTSGDNILVFKPHGTHSAFKQKLREHYERLPRVTPADIPDDPYASSKEPITPTAVKNNRSSDPHIPSASSATTYTHGGSTSTSDSRRRPPRHLTGIHSLSSHSMSLRKRINNVSGSIHSSRHSLASSSMSQATTLAGQSESPKKRTSDRSGDPYSPVVPKRLRSSGK